MPKKTKAIEIFDPSGAAHVDNGVEPASARKLLERSLEMIETQLTNLNSIARQSHNMPLDKEYMHALLDITKTLVVVDSNKNKYPDENDDLSGMSDEELQAEVQRIMAEEKKK